MADFACTSSLGAVMVKLPFSNKRGAVVPLAEPHGICSVAQYRSNRPCPECSQSASIYQGSKGSERKALIFLLAATVGDDSVRFERPQ